MTDAERIQTFVDYTSTLDGDEKGEAQVFLDRLFIGFGHKGYKEAGATLEKRVRTQRGTTSFSDLIWSPRLLLEMKKRGEKLQRHYQQAFEYWLNAVPNRPRYVVLCNFDEFWIYDFDLQLNDPIDKIALKELTERYTALNFLFPDERRPLFGNDRVAVTREAANKVATAFNAIVDRGEDRAIAQRFILQCVTAMFAEDIDLLPRGIFAQLLQDCVEGASTYDLIGGLFRQMNDRQPARGGRYQNVHYFNGGLFSEVVPIELQPEEIRLLREATDENWSKVQPPVFGTLFQQSMDKEEQHAFGAHFTSEADIQRVVTPTIVRPWRERIFAATKLKDLLALRDELARFHVLDPACGSGNFLYVAYRELKHVEFELLTRIHDEFATGWEAVKKGGSVVSLHQFHGIDVIPFAVELAKLTLTIGKTLAIDEARASVDAAQMEIDLEHDLEKPLPLENLDNQIVCDDALFCDWPNVDAIIGNPPFQSKNKMQQEFPVEYIHKVRDKYPEIPGRADFCVYWFRRAHDELRDGSRAGLVGTNTIRQNYSREGGLDYIAAHGGTITEAVSTQEWSGDAVVHVSIVNWIKGKAPGKKKLFLQEMDKTGKPWVVKELDDINTSLSFGLDVSDAVRLDVNAKASVCYQGQTHGHKGFLLPTKRAKELIDLDGHNAEVVRPYMTARELLSSYPLQVKRYVIDFHPRTMTQAARYTEPFAIVREQVLPDRQSSAKDEERRNKAALAGNPNSKVNKHHANFLKQWWLLSYAREELIESISKLGRYIVCGQVTKRPIFAFLSTTIRPNAALQVFAFEDDYSFGVLQSSAHWEWFVAKCSTLKGDYRYTSNTVFDTFCWPQSPTMSSARAVAERAKELRGVRSAIMHENKWCLRDVYRTLELPGDHPVKDAQESLDKAVRAAYGMKKSDDAQQFLFDLNQNLAEKEAKKERVVGPGLRALGGEFADAYESFVSEDYIVGS